jgi:membrane-associated phospholipid phosphatase
VLDHHQPAPLPVLRRRVLVVGLVLLALAVLVTALVAAPGTRPGVQRVDGWFGDLMVDARWDPGVRLSKLLSTVFGAAVDWPLRAVVTVLIAARRHWVTLGAWATTVLAGELCTGPLKALVDRPRPPGPLIDTSGSSYPSGHAIASAITAIGVVMALTSGRRRLHWMIGAVLLAAAVALSRTYLSAHWLTDVLGGSLIGAGLALSIPEAFEVARDRVRARRPGPVAAG